VNKQEALFVALACGAIAFAFVFILPVLTGEPMLWYYPLEHRWALAAKPDGLALDFYGRTLQATAAWAVVVMVALPIARRRKSLSTRAVGLVAAWVVAAVLLVMLHYAWTLHFRHPIPEPIPSWYQPR